MSGIILHDPLLRRRAALALLLALVPLAGAPAQEMLRRDRLAILYSNQVIFDRRGEPLVSVRISEGLERVEIGGAGRLVLLPGGDDGAQVRAKAGARWTITLADARPGRVRYWVAAEHLAAADMERASAARAAWAARGHEVALLESGALLGLAGRTLDTRIVTVAIDPQPSEAAARERAAAIAATTPILGEVVEDLVERPGGTIIATEAGGTEVRAADLLWISPEAGRSVDVGGRGYQGDVYLAVGSDGALAVVNVLSAETLLEGVVPAELFPSAPAEALKAQAVAARGELLAKVGTRHRGDPYLLCAEVHCQVYGGESKRDARATAAVTATRGQLLFHPHGLVDTVYSSACGGHGEAYDRMWGGQPKPGLPGGLDVAGPAPAQGPPAPDASPYDEAALARYIDSPPAGAWCAATGKKVFRWTVTRSGDAVTRAVNALAKVGEVHTIRPVRRGVSGRALAVEYVGTLGRHVLEGEYKNRQLLGKLRSGLWIVTRDGDPAKAPATWTFRGGGFGHGVGMCQHGAMGMAAKGNDFRAILSHYYPGSTLERIW